MPSYACVTTNSMLVVLLTAAVVGSDEFSVHEKHVGESFELHCTVRNVQLMIWQFRQLENQTEYLIGNARGVRPEYKDRFMSYYTKTSETCRLQITELHVNDSGFYICMDFNGSTWYNKLTARLIVLDTDDEYNITTQQHSTLIPYSTSRIHRDAESGGTLHLLLVVLSVASFVMFLLSVTYIIFKSKIKRLFSGPQNNSNIIQNTPAESAMQVYEEVIRPPVEMDSVCGDVYDSVPLLPSNCSQFCRPPQVDSALCVGRTCPGMVRTQHSSSVHSTSSSEEHGYDEVTGTKTPSADVIYVNVPIQEPHYASLNPCTVELPSREPKVYTKLHVADTGRDYQNVA